MAEETKKTEFEEVLCKFDKTEHAWLKAEAGKKSVPLNLIVRECVVEGMEKQIRAELAPVGSAAQIAAPAAFGGIAPPPSQQPQAKPILATGELPKMENGFLNAPELLAFYNWCANNVHHQGAAELANILYPFVRGESIKVDQPKPVTAFGYKG